MKTNLFTRLLNFKYYSNSKITKTKSGVLIAIFGIIGFLFNIEVKAQSAKTYAFAASTRSFVPLTGATQITSIRTDEAITPTPISLGFTFNYAGQNFTQVYVSSNGFICFPNMGPSPTNNLLSASNSSFNVIAPFWDDLKVSASSNADASYKTTGTIGSRVFTFEWLNWGWNTTAATISFQVLLYETSGKIEFSYRREAGSTGLGGASIGIAAPAQIGADYLSLDDASTNPVASSNTNTINISTRPATNQLYTFFEIKLKR